MFFPDKIKSIKPTDKVLEVGPGGTPFERSDVFLELDPKLFKSGEEESFQRGHAQKLVTDKPIFYYDGEKFPFNDKEFDYVICSHVLEHVKNPRQFLRELFRVAPRGYLEYPTIYYEYLYNFSVHLNLLKFKKEALFYLNKSKVRLDEFKQVQDFFYGAFVMGHTKMIDDLKDIFFEGFEWSGSFEFREARSISDLVFDRYEVTKPLAPSAIEPDLNLLSLTKIFLRKVLRR